MKQIDAIKRKLKKDGPEIVIAFTPEFANEVGWATRSLRLPCILALRISPELELAEDPKDVRRKLKLARFYDSLEHYSGVTVQIADFSEKLPTIFRSICKTIPNEVDFERFIDARNTPLLSRPKNILCVCSLEKRKRVDWLINAFEQVSEKYPAWRLLIYGKGQEAENLIELAQSKRCASKIEFKGVTEHIESVYADAQICCLPSRFEGIPRAVMEGIASGLPAVGVDDCDGMRFLLSSGSGCLSRANEGANGLAKELAGLINADEIRSSISQQGIDSLRAFDPEIIFSQWENYFYQVAPDAS